MPLIVAGCLSLARTNPAWVAMANSATNRTPRNSINRSGTMRACRRHPLHIVCLAFGDVYVQWVVGVRSSRVESCCLRSLRPQKIAQLIEQPRSSRHGNGTNTALEL